MTNGTLQQIDRNTGADAFGEPVIATGSPISVRCLLGGITASQLRTNGATISEAERSCFVKKSLLTAAGVATPPAPGDRLTTALDGDAALVQEIVKVNPWQLNSISTYEIFLKRL